MSPTCLIKPKQSICRQKLNMKQLKKTDHSQLTESMIRTHARQDNDRSICIELDTKCSCSPFPSADRLPPSIQFSRRYLQCQSSMPIRILRSFIEQILPHSSMTQVSIFDVHDRLVDDSHLVSSLPPHNHSSSSSSSSPIPLRFTLVNTVTSLAHCPCASSPSLLSTRAREQRLTSSASPNLIRRETIDRTLSTCALLHKRPASPLSPCLSTPPFDSCASTSMSMSIVNLLSPPSSHSSFLMDNNNDKNNATGVDTALQQQQAMIDEITSQFGEICPPLPKKTRKRATNKAVRLSLPSSLASSNAPLDLSVKKRASPSPSSFFPAQTKWIRT